jgi:hypothetical protein
MNFSIDDLVGDLSADQLRALMTFLWKHSWSVRRANIKRWRMDNGLHVDRPLLSRGRQATDRSQTARVG